MKKKKKQQYQWEVGNHRILSITSVILCNKMITITTTVTIIFRIVIHELSHP